MLNYLVCYIGLSLHDLNSEINVSLKFDKLNDANEMYILTIITSGVNLANYNLNLNLNNIMENLIYNLSLKNKYDYIYKEQEHTLTIYYSNDSNNTEIPHNDPNYYFNQKYNISNNMRKTMQPQNNLLIFEDKQIEVKNGFIFINVDDEQNIKGMHTLLFQKLGIDLVCCATEQELRAMLVQVYAQSGMRTPKVVVLLDNVLDRTTGLELYQNMQTTQQRFNLDIEWIVVTSTEDQLTYTSYMDVGIKYVINKPLTMPKIKSIFENINYEIMKEDESEKENN
eukprot:Mrub_05959.p1 GENE.Mrub_05959~~Mrub_05959.p1  ORF type:complete len:318 (+),score=48.39 Mrub_05959:109-954(+)